MSSRTTSATPMTCRPSRSRTAASATTASTPRSTSASPRRASAQQFGGNDTMTAEPDVTIPIVVAGGSGNDILRGARGNDVLDGGDGNDTLEHARRPGRLRQSAARAPTPPWPTPRRSTRSRPTSRTSSAGGAPPRPPLPAAGALKLPKTAKVDQGRRLDQGLLPGRHRGLQAAPWRCSRPSTIKVGKLKAKLELGAQVLRGRRGPEQDDQGQARPRHGQAGQEEEAGRDGPRRREGVEADAELLGSCFHVVHVEFRALDRVA